MFRVVTFNVEWFFTSPPAHIPLDLASPEDKAKRLAAVIANFPEPPEVIALQEVEGEREVSLLCSALLQTHALTYHSAVGHFCSVRTGQCVAFLYSPSVEVRSFNSFRLKPPLSFEPHVAMSLGEEDACLLEKNVYLECEVLGQRTFIVNVHLKASNDPESCAIRLREAVALQGFVEQVRRGDDEVAVILLGDFNDGDPSLEATTPSVFTQAVTCIRESRNVVSPKGTPIRYASATQVLPRGAKATSVHGILIDHILVDERHFQVAQCLIARHPTDTDLTPLRERVSDHFPVYAWLKPHASTGRKTLS